MVPFEDIFLRTLINTLIYILLFWMVSINLTKTSPKGGWLLIIIFCVFAFWNSDYYSFQKMFQTPKYLEEFRDPLYQYLAIFALGSYSLFRLYIWGTALWVFRATLKRFNLNPNIALYTFVSFFLLMFSYARASLGMALCFYAFSFLSIRDYSFIRRVAIATLLFVIAFFAHRSMGILILIMFVSLKITLNKKSLTLILLSVPLLSIIIRYLISFFESFDGNTDDMLFSFTNSAQKYSSMEAIRIRNWKFILISNINLCSYYIATIFIIQTIVKQSKKISPIFTKLAIITLMFVLTSLCLKFMAGPANIGIYALSYRILYMCGIPIVILLTYLYQNHIISRKIFCTSLLLGQIYAVTTFVGTLVSNI